MFLLLSITSWIIAFTVTITIHEFAHAWVADKLGDPTPRLTKRLTLNPIAHYDPVGTTLLLVLTFLRALGAPVIPFGWAKPVLFDPYNLKNPRRDSALISLAGPAANLALATLLAILLKISASPFSIVQYILTPLITLNVILAIFNLVPIHPLDGGKILVGLLPENDARELDKFLHRYGTIILFLLIFPSFGGTSPMFSVISPIINAILKVLLPQNISI